MITIKTMKHIPTARTIASFRAVGRWDGRMDGTQQLSLAAIADRHRQLSGSAQFLIQEDRRQWLSRVWHQRSNSIYRKP